MTSLLVGTKVAFVLGIRFIWILVCKLLLIHVVSFLPKYEGQIKRFAQVDLTAKSIAVMWTIMCHKMSCSLQVGMRAPEVPVLTLDKKEKKLLDFQQAGRMLVVNFGSCT